MKGIAKKDSKISRLKIIRKNNLSTKKISRLIFKEIRYYYKLLQIVIDDDALSSQDGGRFFLRKT